MASLLNKILKRDDKPEAEAKGTEPAKRTAKAKKDKKEMLPAKTAVSNASKKSLAQAQRILKRPRITEKTGALMAANNQYVFDVSVDANKTEVAKVIAGLYNVKVEQVRMIHTPGKKRRTGKHAGWKHGLKQGCKKAVVTLKEGDKIEDF